MPMRLASAPRPVTAMRSVTRTISRWSISRSSILPRRRASVEDGAAAVPRDRLVARLAAAIPQPAVEGLLVDAQALRDRPGRVHRAGADLALRPSGGQQPADVDVLGQARLVAQDAVDAQDVGDEIVGEDRQAVQVVKVRDA